MTTTAPARPAPNRPGRGTAPGATPRPSAGASVAIDPIRVVRRHLILLIVALFVGVGLGYAGFKVCDRYFPEYTGEVLLRVSPPLRDPLDPVGPRGERDDAIVRLGRTEIEQLLQRETIGRVLRASVAIREQTVWAQQFYDDQRNFAHDEAIDELRRTLRADMVRNANYFYVRWSAPTASDVPVVLTELTNNFIVHRQNQDKSRYDGIVSEWDREIERRQQDVDNIQAQIDRFVRDNNITAADTRTSQLRTAVEDLINRLNEVKANRTSAESMRSQTEAKLVGAIEPSEDDRRMAEEDPLIRSMMASINDLRVALSAARERFGPGHQQIVAIEQRLRAAESEREVAIRDTIRRNLDSRMKVAQLQIEQLESMERSLEAQYRERELQLNEFTAQLLELEKLTRDRDRAEDSRRRFDDARINTMTLSARSDQPTVSVLVPASTPRERSFPKRNLFVAAGAVAMFGLVLGIVFLRELLDQRVRGANDLSVIPGARVLGVIPDLQDDPTRCKQAEMVVRDRPQSVMAEAYRQAAVPLMKTMSAAGHQTLLVVGGVPESGVTTVAVNIAFTDSARGQRVLIIDANFRRPRIAAVTGVRDDLPGLGDILAGTAKVDEAIQSVGDSMWAITAGTPATRIIERLTNSAVDALLAELRTKYDVIVIDAPPAVVASEAMSLANRVDATLLVVRANQDQRGLVARLVHQLADLRSDFVGIILNRPRGTAGGYLRKNYETIAGYARES